MAHHRIRIFVPVVIVALWLGAIVMHYMNDARVYHDTVAARAEPATDRPIEFQEDGYVTSRTCKACHPSQYSSWHASYHRKMTQVATPDVILAPFGKPITSKGKIYEFIKRDAQVLVQVTDSESAAKGDTEPEELQVVMTTGSHHYQAFWVPTGKTRKVKMLPFSYHIADQRFYDSEGFFLFPPGIFPLLSEGQWNHTCSYCHATGPKARVDFSDLDQMDTRVAEFGIACESCHGPAEEHVRFYRNPRNRYFAHLNDEPGVNIVDPEDLTPRLSSQVCGQCHGITSVPDRDQWSQDGFQYRPGDDLQKLRKITRSGQQYFWPDGMIRVSGREYNGLINTPCYTHEDPSQMMTCLHCHKMHRDADDMRPVQQWADDQLQIFTEPGHAGPQSNQACTQCHEVYEDPQALVQHTHHDQSIESANNCYNCHMPHTTWGLLKAIRSHTIDSPSVSTELATGRPNACNICHLDKTLQWTADHLESRYDIAKPKLNEEQQTIAASVLAVMKGDAGQRALGAWRMGWAPAREASGTDWMAPFLAQLLEDPYHAVRKAASNSLAKFPQFAETGFDYMGSADHLAAVRRLVDDAWLAERSGRVGGGDPTVLMTDRGHLMQHVFEYLLRQRDNRPVFLNE